MRPKKFVSEKYNHTFIYLCTLVIRVGQAAFWEDLDIDALAIAHGLWEQSHASKSMQGPSVTTINDRNVTLSHG
jgi:hypothetical protein